MVLYELRLTTQPQTTESQAATARIEVEQPVISNALVFIDQASNGEVRAQLRHGELSLVPHFNADTVSKPGESGPSPLSHRLPGTPTTIELRAWAPNADFTHEVIAQFEASDPAPTTVTVT